MFWNMILTIENINYNSFFCSIVPTVIDIVIAIVYFTAAFNYWFGIIVLATMMVYLGVYFSYV